MDAITRATTYPYPYLNRSFVFVAPGDERPWSDAAVPLDGGRAVIAYGSNQSTAQLAQKFQGTHAIPVQRGWLHDFDVVYAARFTSYGAIPSTIIPSPGTQVDVAITWLTPAQLAIMDRSEGHPDVYRFAEETGARFDPRDGPVPSKLYAYKAVAGHLDLGQGPIALAAIEARNGSRKFPAVLERDIIERTLRYLGRAETVDAFVTRVAGGQINYRHLNDELRQEMHR